MSNQKKKTLEDLLNEVDYSFLNSTGYVPSVFALSFVNFIKAVNGEQGESNKTPPIHLKMLDTIAYREKNHLVNLCARGLAKTTLFGEYMVLYLAVFNSLPKLNNISGMIYVADTMENGAKSLRKNIEYRYEHSEFLQSVLPKAGVKFTDTYLEFTNLEGRQFGVKLFGATTGIRGTKIFGKRPQVAVLDDLLSDESAKSKTVMGLIKDTVYKGIDPALDPNGSLVVLSGTPFNKEDVILEAVESGAWETNIYPVCEKFPCSRKDFNGAWED